MQLSWRERLNRQPSLWQFESWPMISIDSIDPEYQKEFVRNQYIVVNVLSGKPLNQVANEQNVSPGRVTQILSRCLGGSEDAPPTLTQALIPFAVIAPKKRISVLPSLVSPSGSACAFHALLDEVPGLKVGLDEMIDAKIKDKNYAQQLTPHAFHGEFKRLLRDANWPTTRYPYTSASLAYEAVRRYLHYREDAIQLLREIKKEKTTETSFRKQYKALTTTQTDEHTLDISNKVHLVLNDELLPLRLARACVLVTINIDAKCILGFHLAYTRHPNQQDMMIQFDNCTRPWQPMTLTTPGFSYAKGACFPSGLANPFPITFGTMQLDNAWIHHAASVTEFVCNQQGGATSFGHPNTPTVRALVESVFDYINKNCTHRFTSTCGSHPTDPKKESRKNRKKTPTVSLRTLIEALSIILTEYNITPQSALGNATPLDLFRHHCQSHFVRYVPELLRQQWQPFFSEKTVTIHWYKKENRAPHINFCHMRFKGPSLRQALSNNKKIIIRIDRRDVRSVHAYSLTGEDLGELKAPYSWQRFKHSYATHQLIHKENKIHRFNARDPLADYMRFLLDNRGKPKIALQMIRIHDEYLDNAPALMLDSAAKTSLPADAKRNKKRATWNLTIANQRR